MGEGEITQLIQDVIDYLPKKHNYYIGTLVVFERPDKEFETIDGQQRLTTLSLLAAYIKNKKSDSINLNWLNKLNLHFDSRPNSQNALTSIFGNKVNELNLDKSSECNTAILDGYRLIEKILPQKLAEKRIKLQKFSNFLFKNVQIMRVKVPKDTDLNHYFEIMNNRGEQLEKHEILKSRMMEALKNDKESQNCLHMVWEACANMENYVQMGFSPELRDLIFGDEDWRCLNVNNFKELQGKMPSSGGLPGQGSEKTLNEIIEASDEFKPSKNDEAPERFNTVINFPNFLLHVLRVQEKLDVPLDDKKLLSTFESHVLKVDDAAEKIKKFTFDLLRCKFLYDQYVIKREFIKEKDRWSLKRLKDKSLSYVNTFGQDDESTADTNGELNNINRRILMLLSAFHVSNPSQNYKYWLDGALNYLFKQEKTIDSKEYLEYLEGLAKSFVFDRFLSENGGLNYSEIIYKNEGKCQTQEKNTCDEHIGFKLSYGNIENNLLFNFLDYLLWVKHQTTDNIVKDYEFTFRSSVEHYYPQYPLPGHDLLPPDILDSFGNLCLISRSKNSRLSNSMPEAKKEYYRNNTIDSVKQHLMMQWSPWNKNSIKKHFGEMKLVLLKTLELTEELE